MRKRYLNLLFLLFITAITLITYSNHFHNSFHFDDSHTIQDNVHIRNIKNIPQFFYKPEMFSASPSHWGLRPLVTITLAIDYWLGDGLDDTFYFHLSTFIFHLLLCFILFFVFRKILKISYGHPWNDYFALFAASLFAIHTVNAETINYIISRSDVLSTFFILVSFSTYIFFPRLRKTYLYIIPALIGVLAKETILVLPILIFFYVILFVKNLSLTEVFREKGFLTALNIFVSLLPLIVAIAFLQFYNLSKAPGLSDNIPHSFLNYWLTQTFVWVHYFLAFFFPFNLSVDADWGVITHAFDTRILVGFVFIITLIYAIFRTSEKKQYRPVSFSLIWFAAALLPTSLAPLAEVMNDHRMYFPFIGLSFALTSAVFVWISEQKKWSVTKVKVNSSAPRSAIVWLIVPALCILSAYAYGTYQRNKVWKDSETLWYDVTIKSPKNGRGLMNYGLTQMRIGNYQRALDYFNKALNYTPYYAYLHINLGVVKNAMGNTVEAEKSFLDALNYGKNLHLSYYYYANFLYQHQRTGEALHYAETALNMNPEYLHTRHLLMNIYALIKDFTKLNNIIEETLRKVPGDPTTLNHKNTDYTSIRSPLEIAQDNATKNPTSENFLNLSLQYYHAKAFDKCIDACNEALKLKPDYAEAYNNICSAYNAMEDWDKAIEACDKALKIKPDFNLAKNNRNWAVSQKNK